MKTVIAAIACFWTIRLSKSYLAATATAAFLLLRTYVPVSPLLSDIDDIVHSGNRHVRRMGLVVRVDKRPFPDGYPGGGLPSE